MGIEAGVNVLVSVGGTPIVGQRGAKLSYKRATKNTSVKADYPNTTKAASFSEWSISCDGLVNLAAGGIGTFFATAQAGTAVSVEVEFDSQSFTGSAIATGLDLDAPQDDSASYSCSLEGTGLLSLA